MKSWCLHLSKKVEEREKEQTSDRITVNTYESVVEESSLMCVSVCVCCGGAVKITDLKWYFIDRLPFPVCIREYDRMMGAGHNTMPDT